MRERLAEGEEPPIQIWMTANREGRAEVALSATTAGVIITQDDGDVTPITFLAPATQATMRNKKYVGHFSNSLAIAKPMYFDKKDIFGCVLSITSKAIAEANGSWFDDHDLRTPYNVTVTGVPEETANEGKEEEKEETIGFKFPKLPEEFTDEGLNGDADVPVLVAIQKAMPFGYGDNPPSGNVKDENVKISFQELHEYGLMHAQAEYLLKEHGGVSLHKTEGFMLSMLT